MRKKEIINKRVKKARRQNRVRAKIHGTIDKPRVCVFRSLANISAQVINDDKGMTLAAASSHELNKKGKTAKTDVKLPDGLKGKRAIAFQVGLLLAERAKEKKITKIVFDRAGYLYHGRVQSLADGLRQGGLEF